MEFTTTTEQNEYNTYPYKYITTWQSTTLTLSPTIIKSEKYIQYNPYEWTPIETHNYQGGTLHSTTQPAQIIYQYKETEQNTPEHRAEYQPYAEQIHYYYHWHGTPLPTVIEFAYLQGAITEQEKNNLLATHDELGQTPDPTKQQQLYDTLESL